MVLQAKKEKAHDKYVQRTYGLLPGEYAKILDGQGGGCAICGKKPRKRYLAVDHCHTCNYVRGLLCYFCNSALGVFEFEQRTAERASEYLAEVYRDMLRHPLVEADAKPELPIDDLPF